MTGEGRCFKGPIERILTLLLLFKVGLKDHLFEDLFKRGSEYREIIDGSFAHEIVDVFKHEDYHPTHLRIDLIIRLLWWATPEERTSPRLFVGILIILIDLVEPVSELRLELNTLILMLFIVYR